MGNPGRIVKGPSRKSKGNVQGGWTLDPASNQSDQSAPSWGRDACHRPMDATPLLSSEAFANNVTGPLCQYVATGSIRDAGASRSRPIATSEACGDCSGSTQPRASRPRAESRECPPPTGDADVPWNG